MSVQLAAIKFHSVEVLRLIYYGGVSGTLNGMAKQIRDAERQAILTLWH